MTLTRNAYFQISMVCLALATCVLPFAGKSFHLDDPLFIWTGMHLVKNPLDFYGFTVNWYGLVQPMAVVMKNPPLFAYYLAVFGGIVGWSEYALHLACLVPALAACIGIWLLAREFAAPPLVATLAAMFTPVFLLSATTVMCDIMMLSFWVWGIYFWLRGSASGDRRLLYAAALLAAAAGLTKYFGLCLIPLLALYSLAEGNWRRTLPYLLIPLLVLLGYQLWTRQMYGIGLLTDAAGYSTRTRQLTPGGITAALATSLSYMGGGILTALCFTPLLWGKRFYPLMAGLLIAALVLVIAPADINGYIPRTADGRWLQALQLLVFVAGGLGILTTAGEDLYLRRDAKTLLLAAWILGTFFFVCCFNWTVSGRNILPMAPAVGILIARKAGSGEGIRSLASMAAPAGALLIALIVSLYVVTADAAIADASRLAADRISSEYGHGKTRMHFQGHWGFQYYMQQYGATPIDFKSAAMAAGDVMAVPSYGTNIRSAETAGFSLVYTFSPQLIGGVSTMDATLGAGFYMSQKAALPYAFGPVSPAKYEVFLFTPKESTASAR